MKLQRVVISLALLCLMLGCSVRAKVIEGMSGHSSGLPPLDAQYRPGAKFDDLTPAKVQPPNKWYHIPDWSAGVWQSKQHSLIYQFNYKTQKEWEAKNRFSFYLAEERFGKQKDSQGGIWDLPLAPLVNKALSKDWISYHHITNIEYLYVGEDGIVMRVRSVVTLVSRVSNEIASAYQQESISTRLNAGENLMRVRDSIKVYDVEGHPLRRSKVEAIATRVGQFEPLNERNGLDLKTMFVDFLKSQKMDSLIPL